MRVQPAVETYHLVRRALIESARQPAVEISNIFIPMFFFAVTVGAVGRVAGRAFGVENYLGFQMPVAILQAVGAGNAGLGMVTDIERGYFDKLLLTPASRISLVAGRLVADGVRIMLLTLLITVAGLIFGTGMATGPLGVLALMGLGGLFGLAYSGLGLAIALRTGSAQAAQLGFLIFFPLLFLSPAFAPKEVFSPWLEAVATVNPVTYILQGMRAVVLDGWDFAALGKAMAAVLGLGACTLSLVLAALRSRTA
jgi:ABC-2 type transport system permease protein